MKGTWPRMRCCVLLEREPGAEIKKVLIDRGWSMTRLARAAELGRAYTSLVVHGHRRNPDAQRRVAGALGMGMERAFPESGTRTNRDEHRLTRTKGKE